MKVGEDFIEPKEWWIFEADEENDPYESHGFVFDSKKDLNKNHADKAIHVIEYSAYEHLRKHAAQLLKGLKDIESDIMHVGDIHHILGWFNSQNKGFGSPDETATKKENE